MNKFLAFVLMLIFSAQMLTAADQKPTPATANVKPAEQSAPVDSRNKPGDQAASIAVKTKSSFQLGAGARSPFWPIGWKPAGKVASGGGTDQGEVPSGAFLVSSITVDGTTRFAIINGKSMGEGQQFGLQLGTQVYQVTVKRIEDGQVVLSRHDEEIVVPLRRK
jgi:hypothetical protein